MTEESSQENANIPADINNQENQAGDEKSTLEEPNELKEPEKAKNMEIPHAHSNHHERKLKDYIFEFFMLFLAVTAGFFMENMRENYVDNHKGLQYISSLFKDLQDDTTSIRGSIEENETQIKCIDSILVLLEKPTLDSDIRNLYDLTNKYLNNISAFAAREVTITQLRNSGGLRLIENKSASDSIVYYYETYESHAEQQKYNYKILQELIDLEMNIFDLSAYRVKGRKMTFDASRTKEFYNRILLFRSMLKMEVNWLKDYQKSQVSLLRFLEEEYKMKK